MESHSNSGLVYAGRHAEVPLSVSPFNGIFGGTTYVWGASRAERNAARLAALRRELGIRPGRWPMKPARPIS